MLNAGQLTTANACQLQALDKIVLETQFNRMEFAGQNLGYATGDISQAYNITPLIYRAFSKLQD